MPDAINVEVFERPNAVVQIIARQVAMVEVDRDAVIVVRELTEQTVAQVIDMAAHVQVEIISGSSDVQVTERSTVVQSFDLPQPIVIIENVGAGSPVTTSDLVAVAAQALGGQRVVISVGNDEVDYASSDDVSHAGKVIGITVGAATEGDDITVRTAGRMEDSSFSFTPGLVWFDSNGVLTQTTPIVGFNLPVAVALSAQVIVVRIGVPIILN